MRSFNHGGHEEHGESQKIFIHRSHRFLNPSVSSVQSVDERLSLFLCSFALDRRSPCSLCPPWFILLLCLGLSCRKAPLAGEAELPPHVVRTPGVFQDVAPRWSHDGKQIAFLRRTTDRHFQLCVANADLSRITPLLEPEIINPDRPYRPSRAGWRAPEGPVWSPDDRKILFPRVEWMTFPNGETLPGTGLWVYDILTRRAEPVAIHPKRYEGKYYLLRSPSWSPDGKRIAFLGEGLHGETALFVRALDDAKPETAAGRYDTYEDVDWPVWSPVGNRLVFRQGLLRNLTADPLETLRLISPGGREARRLFATNPIRYEEIMGANRSLKTERRFATDTSLDPIAPRITGIAFSPDGQHLAISIAEDVSKPATYSLWLLPVDTEDTSMAVAASGPLEVRGLFALLWIDHQSIGALRYQGEGEGIEVVLIDWIAPSGDSSRPRRLCQLPSDDMDWSPDRRLIVCASPKATEMSPNKAAPQVRTTLQIVTTGL